jgi:cytochrome c biogenesis protein CcdA/thiol-disulfide isomerase/thioredoxin
MTLYIVAFIAGMLTLFSPCILPVLPFVFSRNGRPFSQGNLPLLVGMALTFASVASLGAVAGAWAVQLNQLGRWLALLSLALFSLSLMAPGLATWWGHPFVRAGERLARIETRSPWLTSALLGMATGLIWVPCAGPVLGVILSAAALMGPTAHISLMLLSYATGAAVALWVALRLGSNSLKSLKERLAPGIAGRRVAGAAMLAGVLAVASGLDTTVLAKISAPGSDHIESSLLERVMPRADAAEVTGVGRLPGLATEVVPRPSKLSVKSVRPNLEGGTNWLNSEPLSIASLRGKVVLVNFWTYSCINCLRTLPYVRAWAQKYADRGLVVVGVHTPEFAFEKDAGNVKKALQELKISYPVVQDNDFRLWRAFSNQYWPALYFIDSQGRVRHTQFGEGGQAAAERAIEDLLAEAGAPPAGAAQASITPDTEGVGLGADLGNLRSPETYLGYQKGGGLRIAGSAIPDKPVNYQPTSLSANTWSLSGNWSLKAEFVESNESGNRLALRFQARDANLVIGSSTSKPVRYRVTLDGQPPGANHGTDVDADGHGIVTSTRLYQLVRQTGGVRARTVEIQFLEPGAQAYAFTFG